MVLHCLTLFNTLIVCIGLASLIHTVLQILRFSCAELV